ncbi:MAG: hypothetical protein LC792_03490, partial [Actinobacteria bacterium]|nr:hypothetical protein [Actinomycetota bacterium]
LNSTSSTAVTTLATLLTIGLALMVVMLTGRLVAADAPSEVKEPRTRPADGPGAPKVAALAQS